MDSRTILIEECQSSADSLCALVLAKKSALTKARKKSAKKPTGLNSHGVAYADLVLMLQGEHLELLAKLSNTEQMLTEAKTRGTGKPNGKVPDGIPSLPWSPTISNKTGADHFKAVSDFLNARVWPETDHDPETGNLRHRRSMLIAGTIKGAPKEITDRLAFLGDRQWQEAIKDALKILVLTTSIFHAVARYNKLWQRPDEPTSAFAIRFEGAVAETMAPGHMWKTTTSTHTYDLVTHLRPEIYAELMKKSDDYAAFMMDFDKMADLASTAERNLVNLTATDTIQMQKKLPICEQAPSATGNASNPSPNKKRKLDEEHVQGTPIEQQPFHGARPSGAANPLPNSQEDKEQLHNTTAEQSDQDDET